MGKAEKTESACLVRVCQVAPLGVGGITSMVFNICECIEKKGVIFDYLTFYKYTDCDERIKQHNGKKYVVYVENINNRIVKSLVKLLKTYSTIKENHIKILHINASVPSDILVGLVAKLAGVRKVIFHSHNSSFDQRGSISFKIMSLFKLIIPMVSDYNLACSQVAAEYMFPKSILKNMNYEIINNGIDVKKFLYNSKIRDEYRIRYNCTDKFVVGHIGRFSHQKNHKFIIDIFNEIHKKELKSVLFLFGIGELQDTIKEQVHELGLDKCVFFWGTSTEIFNMLQMMDVFIFPSLYEGLPVSLIEAQTSGVPIIASDTISREVRITDLIQFISLNSSAAYWAEKAINTQKKFTRKDMGQSIIQAGYSIEDTSEKLSNIYQLLS